MNPDAVEWLESQPLIHPHIAAFSGQVVPGPMHFRAMLELIEDHSEQSIDRDPCFACGPDPIIV